MDQGTEVKAGWTEKDHQKQKWKTFSIKAQWGFCF